jgi:hypothetical protein
MLKDFIKPNNAEIISDSIFPSPSISIRRRIPNDDDDDDDVA